MTTMAARKIADTTDKRLLARQQVQAEEKKFYEKRQTRLFSDDDWEALRGAEHPKEA